MGKRGSKAGIGTKGVVVVEVMKRVIGATIESIEAKRVFKVKRVEESRRE